MANPKGATYTELNQATAEKLFNKGVTIALLPSKLDPYAETSNPYLAKLAPENPEETLDVLEKGCMRFMCNARTGMKIKRYLLT